MLIKIKKTTTAAKDQSGSISTVYQAGWVYDIYPQLAEIFIKENIGEALMDEKAIDELENKALDKLENKNLTKKEKNAK